MMRKILQILFSTLLIICAILPYVAHWTDWHWSQTQADLAPVGVYVGMIGIFWTVDFPKKTKYKYIITALFAFFIVLQLLELSGLIHYPQ